MNTVVNIKDLSGSFDPDKYTKLFDIVAFARCSSNTKEDPADVISS